MLRTNKQSRWGGKIWLVYASDIQGPTRWHAFQWLLATWMSRLEQTIPTADNTNCERAMGKHGCGKMNNNIERLDFCVDNNLVIGVFIFPHRNIHKLTWRSPDGRICNQIYHIIISGKCWRSLENVGVFWGANVWSDHNLINATVTLKLRQVKKEDQQSKTTWLVKHRCSKSQKQFVLEVRSSCRCYWRWYPG